MRQKLFVTLGVATLAAAAIAGSASGTPAGGCPGKYAPAAETSDTAVADKNGNNRVCVRTITNRGKQGTILLAVDDKG